MGVRGLVPSVMIRDPLKDDPEPDLETVLDALDDEACRAIVTVLDEPMTAEEISEAADVPLSTTYRKLDRLSEASLLSEGIDIRPDGQHASTYSVDFGAVIVALTESREFEVEISRRPRSADERLADLWSEVRKET